MNQPSVTIIFPSYPTYSFKLEADDMRILSTLFFSALVIIAMTSVNVSAEETAEQGYPEFRAAMP